MKRIIAFILSLVMAFSLAACSGGKPADIKLKPGDMLDTDTGEIYSLGDPRSRFDESFGNFGIDGEGEKISEYIDGILTVTYEDDKAVEIECEGSTNRFEFCNFNFGMDIKDIEGRYEKYEAAGFTFYTRYYNSDGTEEPIEPGFVAHSLMVRIGDFLDMKDGEYLSYTITQK